MTLSGAREGEVWPILQVPMFHAMAKHLGMSPAGLDMAYNGGRPLPMRMAISLSNEILTLLRAPPNTRIISTFAIHPNFVMITARKVDA